jgi:hypothetical protein
VTGIMMTARGRPGATGSLASDGPVPWRLVPGPVLVAGVERLRAGREVAPTRSVDAAMQFDDSFWLVERQLKL